MGTFPRAILIMSLLYSSATMSVTTLTETVPSHSPMPPIANPPASAISTTGRIAKAIGGTFEPVLQTHAERGARSQAVKEAEQSLKSASPGNGVFAEIIVRDARKNTESALPGYNTTITVDAPAESRNMAIDKYANSAKLDAPPPYGNVVSRQYLYIEKDAKGRTTTSSVLPIELSRAKEAARDRVEKARAAEQAKVEAEKQASTSRVTPTKPDASPASPRQRETPTRSHEPTIDRIHRGIDFGGKEKLGEPKSHGNKV